MKKILFAMAVLFGCSNVSFAQTSYIATLQHEGEFTHYYGSGALTSAYNAAETGDIITLSPGTFSSPGTINKSITLRGAGVEAVEKTFITGRVTFVSTDSIETTTVEGIYFKEATAIQNNSSGTGQGTIKLIKNLFWGLSATVANTYSTERGPIVRIYNCLIFSSMEFDGNSHPDFLFYNSFVDNPYINSSGFDDTTSAFVNCVINWTGNGTTYMPYWGYYSYFSEKCYRLNFYNCIFYWKNTYDGGASTNSTLPSTATCHNCLSINKSALFNNLVSGGNNKTAESAADVFVSYTNNHQEGETFELTSSAKETYIGTDGTQIGMQGGKYAYTTTVQYPIITKFSSDPQTNKEGILNVEIEVDGQ